MAGSTPTSYKCAFSDETGNSAGLYCQCEDKPMNVASLLPEVAVASYCVFSADSRFVAQIPILSQTALLLIIYRLPLVSQRTVDPFRILIISTPSNHYYFIISVYSVCGLQCIQRCTIQKSELVSPIIVSLYRNQCGHNVCCFYGDLCAF